MTDTMERSHEATELGLYAINDVTVYRSKTQPVISNLKRKIRVGTYDPAKAPKLWLYVADLAAQRYTKEFGGVGNGSYGCFDKATRIEAATMIADHYQSELEA